MKNLKLSWDAILVASIVFASGLLAQSQPAARADEAGEPEGRIVELNSGASTELPKADDANASEEADKPIYWIGIHGRVIDSELLRTQFQLAEDMGVVVEEVLKDSPAEKAGLRKHDIILRANGEGVQGMEDLAELVSTGEGKPIELQIIRLAKEETIVVAPEARPYGIESPPAGIPGLGHLGDQGAMRDFLARMPGMQNAPGGMRMFGPGVIINGQHLDVNSLPNGVAVTVERADDGPAKITVKQGDKTWNVTSDDAKSLEQLPEEVRNYVELLMRGNQFGQMNNLEKELENMIHRQMGGILNAPLPGPGPAVGVQNDPVLQKMEQLERQLKELQDRLEADEAAE